MAAKTTKPNKYSESALQRLVEPLTVNVSKIVAGRNVPQSIPPGPAEQISGKGYTQDMVRQVRGCIINDWDLGDGHYIIEVTDKDGMSLEDVVFWPPGSSPSSQAQLAAAQTTPLAPTLGYVEVDAGNGAVQMPPPTVPPGYLQSFRPSGSHSPARPIGWAPPPSAPQPPFFSAYAGAPAPVAVKEREEVLKLEAQMQRERQEAQHRRDMDLMTQELRRVQEQIGKRPDAEESAALKQAQREIEELRQQSSTQVLLAQIQSMQQQNAAALQQMQQQTQQTIQSMHQQTTQLIQELKADTDRRLSEASANKSDPTLQIMLQSMQNSQAQAQQQQQMFLTLLQQQQNQAMRPAELMDIFRQANQGADQMASAYGKAWELMANGVEQIMQAQGPSVHPAFAMLGQAAEGGLGVAQRYIEMKEAEAKANAQARQAQAHFEAQARIQSEAIRAGGRLPAPAAQQAQSQPQESEEDGDEESDDDDTQTRAPTEEEMKSAERDLLGEAFGPIQNLRSAIADGKLDPKQTAAAVFQAIEHFASKKTLPPIFSLWQEERFPEFVDLLIPDAHHNFREEVTANVLQGISNLRRAHGRRGDV